MSSLKKYSLFVFVFLIIGTTVFYLRKPVGETSKPSPEFTSYIHPSLFFDQKLFDEGMVYVKNNPPKLSSIAPIHGGVIPHHVVAGYLISDFFERVKNQEIKTIVLIGPNHKEVGNGKVLSSLGAWETPFGKVETHGELIQKLANEDILQLNDEVLTQEHSVGGIMPYIKQYLPNTKVVPIILSGKLTAAETETLADTILQEANENTLIIASVDFSHYLSNREAQKKDGEMKKIMENFEITKVHKLNNDYLDSPPSIALMLHIIEKKYDKKFEILNNSNSGQLLRDDNIQTTSYFEIVF